MLSWSEFFTKKIKHFTNKINSIVNYTIKKNNVINQTKFKSRMNHSIAKLPRVCLCFMAVIMPIKYVKCLWNSYNYALRVGD